MDKSLPKFGTLIAPVSMHSHIRKWMNEHNEGQVGWNITSLSAFLHGYDVASHPSKIEIIYDMYKRIKGVYDQLHIYKKIALSSDFLLECYNFLNDCVFYDIDDSMFPHNSDAQKELLFILRQFDGIFLLNANVKQCLQQALNSNLQHVYILDSMHSYQEASMFDMMLNNGAQKIVIDEKISKKEFYYAVNKRQEVEACAQHILRNDLDASDIWITLCDRGYQDLVEQVFSRYKIPYTCAKKSAYTNVNTHFILLCKCLLNFDYNSRLAVIESELFKGKEMDDLREYMSIFECDCMNVFDHLQNIKEENYGNVMNQYHIERLKSLEFRAELARKKVVEVFASFVNQVTWKQKLEAILQYLYNHLHDDDELRVHQELVELVSCIIDDTSCDEDVLFLLDFLGDGSVQYSARQLCGVWVNGLDEEIIGCKHHYILGAMQSNYPAFALKKGIFDETYYANIKAYPTLSQRYNFYLEQLEAMWNRSECIYASYSVGTYDGKSLEAALEMEQYIGIKPQAYPIEMQYEEIKLKDRILSSDPKQLYLKEGKLPASISSLERYVKCPFSYFLRYGLSIQEPLPLGFVNSYAGTLAHYVLETLTNIYGKAYVDERMDHVNKIIDEEIKTLSTLFPSQELVLENVKQRLLIAMEMTLQSLKEFEDGSSFQPYAFEKAIDYEQMLDDGVVLKLQGFIDRVDCFEDALCILDYKSSKKSLQKTQVFAGLQLQLLTYAFVLRKTENKRIMGAYYVNLKNEGVNAIAGKMRRRPVQYVEMGSEEYAVEKKKVQRIEGWTMSADVHNLDCDASHIVGVRCTKDQVIKADKLYNLDAIEEYLTQMYTILGNRILAGDIACNPLEGACMFCKYASICRFKGRYKEVTPLVEEGDDLLL